MLVHHRMKGKKITQNPKPKRLTAAQRKQLPAKAFGIPKERKYPMMIINKMGKPEWSHSHASDAKARAKEEFDKGLMTKATYNRIVKKADKIIQEAVDEAIPTGGRKKNPSAEVHEKTGRDYMMKARDYYERYLQKGRPNDLVDAFEYLSIAHEELMYAGDQEALKEVKHGKKIAKAELIAKIRPKRRVKKKK